jgi:hypothetical protein
MEDGGCSTEGGRDKGRRDGWMNNNDKELQQR